MKSSKKFPKTITDILHKEKILGIRAGRNSTHRIIGIWTVVVDGRVFVRSYQVKPGGWWQTLVKDPHGEIVPWGRKRGIKVCAVQVKSEKLKDAVSAAYREKYNTKGSIGYVEEMSRSPSRDATMELVAV
ncbi:MAG: DUF2255 family protein [Anaerolineales bacterium]|nr:DUF2255 family protein [Anaerolineales bacterium]